MKKIMNTLFLCAVLLSMVACSSAPKNENTGSKSDVPGTIEKSSEEKKEQKKPEADKTAVAIGTRKNPMPLNKTILFDGMKTMFDSYKVEITLTEIVRGDEALQMAKNGNQFNRDPEEGKEYLFAKFKIAALESKDDKKIDINSASFDLVSQEGNKYEGFVSVSGIEPSINEMYSGATQEGYAKFIVNKDDLTPSIVFLESNNSGIWFTTDPEAKLADGSEEYTSVANNTEVVSNGSSEKGSRRNPFNKDEVALFDGMDTMFDTYKVELTLTEVVRGDEALQMAIKGNQFNSAPEEGKEYLFAKFKITALESKDDKKIDISSASFDLVSQEGNKYEGFVSVSGLEPSINEMYSGATQEGFAKFIVNKEDSAPSIIFLERNKAGIWFALN